MATGDFEQLASRLRRVNEVIAELDPAIKVEAFNLFKDHLVEGGGKSQGGSEEPSSKERQPTDDFASFITKHSTERPADAVKVITAYLYSQYGTKPFSVSEIRELADEAGVTVPDHIGQSLKDSSRNKKSLYQNKGKAGWAPTVHGEKFFKENYKVKKGTKKKPGVDDAR